VTPEDAAATTTLLRAPAAIAAAAFLAGALTGEALSWWRGTPDPPAAVLLRTAVVCVICLPFLVPTDCYRSRRREMVAWMSTAALVASARGAYLCASLYPDLALDAWLIAAGLQVAIATALWLAVFAVRWDLRFSAEC
jgi:hypothetical protein